MIWRNPCHQGFSLVELMISLALGLVLSLAVVQVMVSNRVTNQFNQTISEVQESGRFIIIRLKNELLEAGFYDVLVGNIASGTDITSEAAFVQNHPVILTNDFSDLTTLSSLDGNSGKNDTLVINLLSEQDCTGSTYGYSNGDAFHVVNKYFVSGTELRCQGYDGRVLRGMQNTTSSSGAVTLMDGVQNFQVQYGLSAASGPTVGAAVRYVTADQLGALRNRGQQVVALRIAILMQSSGKLSTLEDKKYTVLDETNVEIDSQHYGQVFVQTIALRNMKNFVRSSS